MRSDVRELKSVLSGRSPIVAMQTLEEDDAMDAVREAAVELGRDLWIWSVAGGVQEGLVAGSRVRPDTFDPIAGIECLAEVPGPAVCALLDIAEHLKDPKVLRTLRNFFRRCSATTKQLVLIDHADLPPVLAAYAHEVELSLPDADEVSSLFRGVLREINDQRGIEVSITRDAWEAVIRNLRGLPRREIISIAYECVNDDQRFGEEDLNTILARKRKALQSTGLLEYVEAPVDLSAIGGLKRLKAWLKQRERAVGEDAQQFGLTVPRGVLMLGVQGAGKSLCAKAIATAWNRPLLRMDVGALYDKYIGESERRLRDSLHQAELMSPNILWIDEIEKAFSSAASQSNDGGLSKRMFGALLTWMQEHQAPTFLVATANDIEALPPELLRKGRFDEIFFVDLPSRDVRKLIFEIHLKKRGRDPRQFDCDALAEAAEGFSGAEIEQAVIGGLHAAYGSGTDVSTEGILRVVRESPPLSVTMREKIDWLRNWARDRCVPAD